MFDAGHINPFLSIINIVIWIILLIKYRGALNIGRIHHNQNFSFFFVFVIVYVVFAFSEADTFHYYQLFNDIKNTNERGHIEPLYFWLIQILPDNGYYLWRLIVWGLALLFIVKIFKRHKLDSEISSFLFSIVLLSPFALTRGSLGFALLLYSISLIFCPNKNKIIFSFIIGLLCAILSIFCHKSIIAFIFIVLLSIIPVGKSYYWITVILFPVLYQGLKSYALWFLNLDIITDDTFSSGMRYLEGDEYRRNIFGIIQQIIIYLPMVLSVITIAKNIYFLKTPFPVYGKILFKVAYNLLYISLLFYNQFSPFLSSRFLHASYFFILIPMIILAQERKKRTFLIISLLFIFSSLYTYLYHLYTAYNNF